MADFKVHQISFSFHSEVRFGVLDWVATVKSFFDGFISTTYQDGVMSTTMPNIDRGLMHLDNVVEGMAVKNTVQLIANLSHTSDLVRINCVALLIQLAMVLDPKNSDGYRKRQEKMISSFQFPDKGQYLAVHELFHYIAPALSEMVIALAAGLECFYTYYDYNTRAICISALTRLIYENEKIFLAEEQLSTIWNMYFTLELLPSFSKYYPDRIVVIRSLGMLAPLYSLADVNLSIRIIESLLKLEKKTGAELEVIKAALKKLIMKTIETRKDVSLFNLLVDIISADDEVGYDLLAWMVENYTNALIPPVKGKKQAISTYGPLVEFIATLSNHFQATPSLVRYGAAVALHASLGICDSLLTETKEYNSYVISGVLDTDYLTSFIYLSILPLLQPQEDLRLEESIRLYREAKSLEMSYDVKTTPRMSILNSKHLLGKVLDSAVMLSTPLQSKQIHRLVNSLDYMTKSEKLRQMELIRIWCGRSEQFDAFLMQSLARWISSSDQEIQLRAIRILTSLQSVLKQASKSAALFIWTYFKVYISDATTQTFILESIIEILHVFPLEKLTDEARLELLHCLFRLTFHPKPKVRKMTYEFLGVTTSFWKTFQLGNRPIAILLLSLGEYNKECLETLFQQLDQLYGSSLQVLMTPLLQIKDSLNKGSSASIIKAYDDLANTIASNPNDYASLIEILTSEQHSKFIWDFYLHDVKENMLIKLEEYSFKANFIQSPIWMALLFTKLGILAPGFNQDKEVPTTPAGRRKYYCGFMQIIFPNACCTDPSIRRCACIAIVKCCFRKNTLNQPMLRSLLEYVFQYFIIDRQVQYQMSAIDILNLLLKLKLPELSQTIMISNLLSWMDLMVTTSSNPLRTYCLELIEVVLLVLPKACSPKLSEIRDTLRSLILDKDEEVSCHASRLYPLVFRCTNDDNVVDFFEYLKYDIKNARFGGPEAVADPLLANLSNEESERVIRCSMVAMGGLQNPKVAFDAVAELRPFLTSPNCELRNAALSGILQLTSVLDDVQRAHTLWICLPLVADLSSKVTTTFYTYIQRKPFPVDLAKKLLTEHPDDSSSFFTRGIDEILSDSLQINVHQKSLNELSLEKDYLNDCRQVPIERSGEGFFLPTISRNLLQHFKQLALKYCGLLPKQMLSEISHFYRQWEKCPDLQGQVMIALSEFGCTHEDVAGEVADILIGNLNQDLDDNNKYSIEGSILGLQNVSEFSNELFKVVVGKLSSSSIPSEGEICAFIYMIKNLSEICPAKIPELLRKYIPHITNPRHTSTKRLWIMQLAVELSLIGTIEDMTKVLDCGQGFVDSLNNDQEKMSVYRLLAKILGKLGPKHVFFRNLILSARKESKSKNYDSRKRALAILSNFVRYMPFDEMLTTFFVYLADPNITIRQTALSILCKEQMLDFLGPVLKLLKVKNISFMSIEKESFRASSDSKVELVKTISTEEIIQFPLKGNDPFNIKYYSSEERKLLTQRYGIPETKYSKHQRPCPVSILNEITSSSSPIVETQSAKQARMQEISELHPFIILHECMKKFPDQAKELLDTTLSQIEKSIAKKTELLPDESEEGNDSELSTHGLKLFANLLVAYDGIGDSSDVIKRLHAFLVKCSQTAKSLRESLYSDVEASFYFFNDHLDIPVTSDEQYDALELFKSENQEAASDMLTLGNAEKFSRVENKRSELNTVLDEKSDYLRRLCILEIEAVYCFGSFHVFSQHVSEVSTCDAIQFLCDMLNNEHRGVRAACVEAAVNIGKFKSKQEGKATLNKKLVSIVITLLDMLTNNASTLYRRKVDLVNVICNFLQYVGDSDIRLQAIKKVIRLWRDPDSETRICSINSVERLALLGIDEVIDCFADISIQKSLQAVYPKIMNEIVTLINTSHYTQKDQLNDLLKWYFQHIKDRKNTPAA